MRVRSVFFPLWPVKKYISCAAISFLWCNSKTKTSVSGLCIIILFDALLAAYNAWSINLPSASSWVDAGLKDLFVDSRLIRSGSAECIRKCIDFERTLRVFLQTDEALHGWLLHNFLNWCDDKGIQLPSVVTSLKNELLEGMKTGTALELVESKCMEIKLKFLPILNEFIDEGRSNSTTFSTFS